MLPPINIDAGLLYQLPEKKTMTLGKFYQGFFAQAPKAGREE
jgi:hypothetical protein